MDWFHRPASTNQLDKFDGKDLMNVYRLVLTVALLGICSSASGQILKPKAQTMTKAVDGRISAAFMTADQSLTAFRSDDFKAYIRFIHPAAIKFAGGKEDMMQALRQGKVALDLHTSGYDTSLQQPKRLIRGTSNLYTVVPQTVTLQLANKQTINRSSYLLGVSADDGRTWKFVDGGTPATDIRKMFPDFPKNERLPNDATQ